MLTEPDCPVCGANDWAIVGERSYRRPASLAGAKQKPLRVLFEVWAPDQQEFRVEFAGCKSCAMMIYLPRPSATDLQAKYEALAQYGDNIPSSGEDPKRTRLRSQRLFDLIVPRLDRPIKGARILDFGGGDGRLLGRFVEAGAVCDLIDYCDGAVPGVRHVGRTADSLPDEPVYDGAICSHVVEHLADPLPILRKVVAALRKDGIIYVEVPVEMLRRMPAGTEPVTHCNFFIPESLATLMEAAGCRVLHCGLTVYPHPSGGRTLCAGAIATPGDGRAISKSGLPALERYLQPSLPFLARVSALMWRSMPRLVARKLMMKLRPPARAQRPATEAVHG